MASYTAYFYADENFTHYVKPSEPIVDSPWADDIITTNQVGTTSQFYATLDSDLDYYVYEQIGNDPASTDAVVWIIPKSLGMSTIIDTIPLDTLLTEVLALTSGNVTSTGLGPYNLSFKKRDGVTEAFAKTYDAGTGERVPFE